MKPNEPAQAPHVLLLLEAVAATAGVMPWGLASIQSAGRLFLWDTRPDASPSIMEAIAIAEGAVAEYRSIQRGERTIFGCLIAISDGSERPSLEALDEVAGRLRARYHIATGPDPRDTEGPF